MSSAVKAAAKHGAKRTCVDCACKYYDLGKTAARCPRCGGQAVADALPSGGRTATSRRARART